MISEDIKNTLLMTRLSHYLSANEIGLLVQHSELLSFAPGELILAQGRKSAGLYIVVQGAVTACTKLLGEGKVCLGQLRTGNFFGEMSVIANEPSTKSFIAEDEVQCLFIKNRIFYALNLFFPETKYQITQAICNDVLIRFKNLHEIIMQTLAQFELPTNSILRKVVQSFTKPVRITFADTLFTLDQLKKNDFFNAFSLPEIEILIENSTFLKVPKNCVLIHENEQRPLGFVVLRGAIQSNLVQKDKLVKLSVLGPFKFLGSLSIIDSAERSFVNYTACEKTIVLYLSEENIVNLKNNYLPVWYKFYELMSRSFIILKRSANELNVRLKSEL